MASAQVRAFALLGDSNIQRHINKTSVRAHPDLKKAQVLPCGHLDIFAETLGKIKPDVTVCILSCLTNFLASADGPSTVSHRINPRRSGARSSATRNVMIFRIIVFF